MYIRMYVYVCMYMYIYIYNIYIYIYLYYISNNEGIQIQLFAKSIKLISIARVDVGTCMTNCPLNDNYVCVYIYIYIYIYINQLLRKYTNI